MKRYEKKGKLEISVISSIIGQFCYIFGHLSVIIRFRSVLLYIDRVVFSLLIFHNFGEVIKRQLKWLLLWANIKLCDSETDPECSLFFIESEASTVVRSHIFCGMSVYTRWVQVVSPVSLFVPCPWNLALVCS